MTPIGASAPRRMQRRRTAGWHKPTGSVIVDRTSRWGNPFAVGRPAGPLAPNPDEVVADRARAVALYRQSSYAAGKAGLWAAARYDTDRPRSGVSLPGRGTVPWRGPARRRQPR
jgi:Domain of unknown function (DUF4326)